MKFAKIKKTNKWDRCTIDAYICLDITEIKYNIPVIKTLYNSLDQTIGELL